MTLRPIATGCLLLALSLTACRIDETLAAGCGSRHVLDALKLNEQRKPRYSALTGGRSEKVSSQLMSGERRALPVLAIFDLLARKYQRQGIPLFCDEFVSMENAPEFRERALTPPEPLTDYKRPDGARIAQSIKDAYDQQGFEGVSRATEDELRNLAQPAAYHCMLRHLLESILRASNLAPRHIAQAQAKGLDSPASLSWRFIWLQLFVIGDAIDLDEKASTIQSEGVPLLCQDLPPIPPR